MGVEGVFLVVAFHPVGGNGPPPAYYAQDTALVLHRRHAPPGHPAMDGDEIHPVRAVFLNDFKHVIGGHLHDGPASGQHPGRRLIDGDGADHQGGSRHDGPADRPDIAPRGEVHDGVRAGFDADPHLFQFIRQIGPVLGGADIGVDLGPQALADGQGRDGAMDLVPDDDDGPRRHAGANELRRAALPFRA